MFFYSTWCMCMHMYVCCGAVAASRVVFLCHPLRSTCSCIYRVRIGAWTYLQGKRSRYTNTNTVLTAAKAPQHTNKPHSHRERPSLYPIIPLSHYPFIPLSLIPLSLYPFIPLSLIPYPLSHIPYPISHIPILSLSYPLSHIPDPFGFLLKWGGGGASDHVRLPCHCFAFLCLALTFEFQLRP